MTRDKIGQAYLEAALEERVGRITAPDLSSDILEHVVTAQGTPVEESRSSRRILVAAILLAGVATVIGVAYLQGRDPADRHQAQPDPKRENPVRDDPKRRDLEPRRPRVVRLSAVDRASLRPQTLLDRLAKNSDTIFAVQEPWSNWVLHDLAALLERIDSTEPSARIVALGDVPRIDLQGRTTVGAEAMRLVSGYRYGFYPIRVLDPKQSLASRRAELRAWWAGGGHQESYPLGRPVPGSSTPLAGTQYFTVLDLIELGPLGFLERRRGKGGEVGVEGFLDNWVTAGDVKVLELMLDSKELCSSVARSNSSFMSLAPNSTIGREAAYLIEAYHAGLFPPRMSSLDRIPLDSKLMKSK